MMNQAVKKWKIAVEMHTVDDHPSANHEIDSNWCTENFYIENEFEIEQFSTTGKDFIIWKYIIVQNMTHYRTLSFI